MSPQMNGEQRDGASSTPDLTGAPISRPSGMPDADHRLPQAIDTDAVVKTTIKDDAKLAPLFTQDVAMDFRSRWDVVQRGFVDDPQAAVRAGDELVSRVIKSLAQTFANQRSELEKGLDQSDAPTTENLRIALRQYRSFFERLLSI